MSTRSQKPLMTSGMRSLAKPGSMPEVKQQVPPAAHAASSWRTIPFAAVGGYSSETTDVDTTCLPDSRMRHMSSTASCGRRSPVAV